MDAIDEQGTGDRQATPFRDADDGAPWFEATIPELGTLPASGQLSAIELTAAYLDRIGRLDPLRNSVLETNPDALASADARPEPTSGSMIDGGQRSNPAAKQPEWKEES
jgi:hypothetical protein